MPQKATGPAPGDGYCNYCETADVEAFGVTTDENPAHAGWKRCSQYKCRKAAGVVKEKPKKEKDEREKPPKPKPAAESAAAAAETALSESDDDPNDIDPTSAKQYDGIVTLLEAREILGHRAFDPFWKRLAERGKRFLPDADEIVRRRSEFDDEYLVRGQYCRGEGPDAPAFEDTRYVFESELRDVLREDDGGGAQLGKLLSAYLETRLLPSCVGLMGYRPGVTPA